MFFKKSRRIIYCLFSKDRDSNKQKFEKEKKEAMKKSTDHENVVVLSLVIEASIEASFQVSVTKCKI